ALIAFTSGSTGMPKGIAGRQGPLSHFIPWQCRELGLGEDDRFSMLSGIAHDPLQRDMFTPLQIGGTLCIPDPEQMGTPGWIAGWMAREGITVAHLTPAMGQLVAEGAAQRGSVGSLRYVFLVGDALTRRDADRLREIAPRVTCVNFYGSTETQRSVGYFVIPQTEEAAGVDRSKQVLPLGKGMQDVQLLVINRSGAQAGVGELGEIGVRGPHLARGYLNDPVLTAEKFVQNPWGRSAEDRIYRTGDLGRYRADGNVVFAGRADQQVKIRGFRIELGEIEATLGLHPAIQDVAVTAREDRPGEKRLVAYYVARPGKEPAVAELREHLRERLPLYMVPAAFVPLAALPLTPNRKLDRKALPAPPEEVAEAAGGAPLDAVEERLADIWAGVLRAGTIGRLDNFFDRGGHSLLATQLVARARDVFGVEVPLRSLFESPTVAGMAEVLRAGREGGLAAAALPQIVPSPSGRNEPFPLTDVQEAYWIGRSGSFDRGTVATHVYFEVEGSGIDVGRFERAWRRLIERHDMLRAVVLPDGRQKILAEVPPYRIEVQDLSREAPEAVEAALQELRGTMSHQVLPSERWPLFDLRASLLPGGRTRLHVGLDMLIGDALSFRILQREVLALYREPEAVLEPLEVSFRDYVCAVAEMEGGEIWRRSLSYWRERLKTLPPAPELPLAVSPSALGQPRFVRMSAQLDPAVWSRLKERAGRARITPTGVLLAAFGELLALWSKSPRFTLNLTLFNRLPLHPQVQSVVGDFTSVTLLEIDTTGEESFEERARRLQGRLWSDLDHRYVSGVRVMREARASRGNLSMPVVFTSTLGMTAAPAASLQETLDAHWVYGISQTSQVWLDHQVTEQEGTLHITWDAVEDLFPAGFLDEAFTAYLPFLSRLADDEDAWRLPALPLVPAEQLAPRLAANATAGPVPEGLLHSGFLAQAALRPAAPAVISLTRILSYQDLERRSLRLAGDLRRRGARPGSLVGVVMEKGWEQVVAVLAILRAGAAYLPIDPGLPAERVAYLLENGQVEIALTQSWVDEELAWPEGIVRLPVDTAAPADAAEPPSPAVQTPGDLAYVIFTSGSTGQPKGVMIDHRGALNTVADINRRFGAGSGDRVLALSALSFDLSVWDIFGILGAGGTIVIPEPGAARDPSRWQELILEEGVTVWNTVPALMEMLVELAAGQSSPTVFPTLRLVMMSGDWIPLSLPPRIKALAPQAQIISLGGATEASIWSNWYPAGEVDPAWRSIPYGWPLTNQSFHVLDDRLRPRPTWVPGQLHIGGLGLARGYWRDEERTGARFIVHPVTGERLYRTGDGGRYLPDGSIEFLGRDDLQVKIQGYRIELGEIEAALARHPALRAAVVVATGDRSSRRLVAYVVPEREAAHREAPPPAEAADREALLQKAQRLQLKMQQGAIREDLEQPYLQLRRPPLEPDLVETWRSRRTHRSFLPGPVPAEALEQLLASLLRIDLEGGLLAKYRYPSAGSLYPVQTYLHVKPGRVAGIAGGVYYYNPRDHRLVLLTAGVELDRGLHAEVNRTAYDESAFSLFLVGVLSAIAPVYGELARDFCLLEAGAMLQLLMTSAPAAGLGICPIGRLDFAPVRSCFALGEDHVLLHTLVCGRPADTAARPSPASAHAVPAEQLTEDLRVYLEGKLPRYMVPSAWMVLDELPLTANGKVDRQALPEPRELRTGGPPRAAAVAPRGEVEERLSELLREILGTPVLGVHDNFFELGGTSVHLVRAHARIRELFDREIPVVEMFSHPTVHALAKRIAGAAEAAPAKEQEESRDRKLAEGRSRLRQRALPRSRDEEVEEPDV
ncbi:MAG TPA: non-ribosomal peptide synthetase, partial [Acidobacteria bacterium]|nr:non-ribosomal peptide synthetase [Acidobacteriota bacterium]